MTAIELHNDIERQGLAGVHELDICAMNSADVDPVRNGGGGPFDGPVLTGWELKAYDETAALSKGMARDFLMGLVEADPLSVMPTPPGDRTAKSPDVDKIPFYAFLTTATFSGPTKVLLRRYGVLAAEGACPADRTAIVTAASQVLGWMDAKRP